MSTTTEENDEDEISIEPSRAFTEALVEQVNREDVKSMVQFQRDMMSRFEKTNEMLINFNILSCARFEATTQEFRQHTQILGQMKTDLDVIFRRIRSLKQRLGVMYPEAFAACSDVYNILENSEDEGKDKEDKEGKEKEDCPVAVSVTDMTNSDQNCEAHHNSANKPIIEPALTDAVRLSDELQSSCTVTQTDFVETNGGTGDTINKAMSSEILPQKEIVSSSSIINEKESGGLEDSPRLGEKSVENIENGT